MTIWSKYFDVSGMMKPRLALHRTLRQLGFPISAGERILVPGWAQLGAGRSLFLSGRPPGEGGKQPLLSLGHTLQSPGEL